MKEGPASYIFSSCLTIFLKYYLAPDHKRRKFVKEKYIRPTVVGHKHIYKTFLFYESSYI